MIPLLMFSKATRFFVGGCFISTLMDTMPPPPPATSPLLPVATVVLCVDWLEDLLAIALLAWTAAAVDFRDVVPEKLGKLLLSLLISFLIIY